MRICVTIPHFFNSLGHAGYASVDARRRGQKIRGLQSMVIALKAHFGSNSYELDFIERKTRRLDDHLAVDIFILTTGREHLLGSCAQIEGLYEHVPTTAEPMLLGYECHRHLGRCKNYDYYCYLEDDLVIQDPMFFDKLGWFNQAFGDECLLLPLRLEFGKSASLSKLCIDGRIEDRHAGFGNREFGGTPRSLNICGTQVDFERPLNPHAGCFFINARQHRTWVESPHFNDRDTSFVGPLESAATLSMIKTFTIYKPCLYSQRFLNVVHAGGDFIQKTAMGQYAHEKPLALDAAGGMVSQVYRSAAQFLQRMRSVRRRLWRMVDRKQG